MTDNRPAPPWIGNDALDKLPLFASDHEIAVAIVGKERAAYYKSILPTLERRGFPQVDPLHKGRAVALVKKFYEGYFGITAGFVAKPDGDEREWVPKRERNVDKQARAKTNAESSSRLTEAEKKARAKANAEAWAERKRNALEEFRAKKAAQPQADSQSRVLTRKEAAAMCKLTPAGFDVWVRKGIMPSATPGTRRWDRHAIYAALDRLSGLETTQDTEGPFEKWERENGRGQIQGHSNRKIGPGGYEIITDPNHPIKKQYDELGFDPATMGEKEMMELLNAADERWRASIPGTRIGKRESKALLRLAEFGVGVPVRASEIKGCQSDTEARLEARGFVEMRKSERFPDQIENYVLTEDGFAVAKKLVENRN